MTIEEIYADMIDVIEKGYERCYAVIKKEIESDDRFSLSDEELSELILELVHKYTKPNYPVL